ncbi:5309_t:CDS:2, partial [Funneliformis caledonium]
KILNPTLYNIQDTIDENLEDLTNELEHVDITNEVEVNLECKGYGSFYSGWTLQQHQKVREPVKRIPIHIKQLLET